MVIILESTNMHTYANGDHHFCTLSHTIKYEYICMYNTL